MRQPFLATGLVLSIFWPVGAFALQKPSPKSRVLPDFDSRAGTRPPGTLSAKPAGEPLERLKARLAGPLRVRIHPATGTVRVVWAEGEALSPAGGGGPFSAAERFIEENAALLGLQGSGARTLVHSRGDALAGGELTRVVFEQVVDGIPVFEGVVWAHVDRLGRVVKLASGALHRGRGQDKQPVAAALTAEEALRAAVGNVRPELAPTMGRRSTSGRSDRSRVFERGPFRAPIPVSLVWFPTPGGDRLAWRVRLEPDGFPQVYDMLVDAQNGRVLYRRNLVRYADGVGTVPQSDATQQQDARLPDEHPLGSGPAGPGDPQDGCPPVAGYQSRNLVAPFRDAGSVLRDGGRLQGNNASVYRTTSGVFGALGTLASGAWQFDYPFGSADSGETALFFASNFAHDFYYDLGFDEASGNFQADNFGRGGSGGDALVTLARADGRNNASFEPTPEGQRPTMSLFLFDGAGCWSADVDGDGSPDIDGGYDRDIVLHEYHHGVTFRLNPSFTGVEADAIGEGGGDFFAYSVSGSTRLAEYSVPPAGIREVNDKTYADWSCLFFFYCEPHDNGEIWANVLWDLRERFRADLVLGTEAAAIGEVHRLYLDGLRLSPPSPTMPDLRDAILQADLLRNPGPGPGGSENYCRIWTVFAGRGLGTGALDTQDTGDNSVVADDQIPGACPQPTRVTLAVTDAQAAEAGLDPGSFTIRRTGDVSQDLTVLYTTSGTATPGADYAALPGFVTIPAGSAEATVVVSPIDDTLYEANETVKVTLAADPAYELGHVVSGTVTLVSDDLGADLVVLTLTVPASAAAGVPISVSDTAKNQGKAAAEASVTSFYLSRNAVLDGADTLLGSRPVPSLAPTSTSTAATPLTIPEDTVAGSYYILARADSEGVVSETNESNNTRAAFVAVGADLVVSALTAPGTGGAGSTISVSDTTKNQGGGAAGGSVTQFFLSTNGVLDGADLLLGSRPAPSLGAAATSTTTTSLLVPAGTASGSYYILARADGELAVSETNENNNTRSAFVAVGPDLVVGALAVPAAVGAGATITVTDTAKNQGGGVAGASTTRFFLSKNAVPDQSDVLLGNRAAPSLAAATSSTGSSSFVIPPDTLAGNYYVVAQADGEGVVPETNEANNTRTALVYVGPDLVITSLTVPSSTAAGAMLGVTDTTKNQGAGEATASRTSFYLSTNATFDVSDVLLGSRDLPSLAAGAISTAPTMLAVPADTAAGGYYVLARADDAGVVAETYETNNTRAAFVAVGPDLVVSAFTVPATARSGSTIGISDTTKNQGAGAAGASQTRYYLSTNALLDASDILLGSRLVPDLGPAATSAAATSVILPAGIAPRLYYVLARADADLGVGEANETNNMRVAAVTISSP